MNSNDIKKFKSVFGEERATIGKPGEKDTLYGLAFSGGGIRSATFNLGIIQSLARNKLLDKFDYLSTVSGGSYIGSWLSAQLFRCTQKNEAGIEAAGNQKVEHFQRLIASSKESGTEPDSIKWLRSYSNYLTPRKGLSGDTLSALGTWLRNTLLNQTALALFFAVAILLPQLVLLTLRKLEWLSHLNSSILLPVSASLIIFAILLCAVSLPRLRCCDDGKRFKNMEKQFVWLIIPIAVLAAYSLSLWMYSISIYTNVWLNSTYTPSIDMLLTLWKEHSLIGGPDNISLLVAIPAASFSSSLIAAMWSTIYVLPWIAYLVISMLSLGKTGCTNPEDHRISKPLWFALGTILSALLAGAFGGWLIYLLSNVIARQDDSIRLWWAASFGTPLLLLIFSLILMLHQGLMARLFRVSQMEWWARLGGYVLFIAGAWAGIHILMIYAPPLLNMLESHVIAAGGLLWFAHSLGGVIFGKSAGTSGLDVMKWKERITATAPYVFVLGCLVATSWAVHVLMHKFKTAETPQNLTLIIPKGQAIPDFSVFLEHSLQISHNTDIMALWYALIAGSAAFILLAWRLDVNLFSIHHFYRNRLTRCYLGAGRGDSRVPNAFTSFDPCDDIKMTELKQRPLHLVNTALNLVRNGDLAWQDRKAYSFTFSPIACGFEYPPNANRQGGGFCDSAKYMGGVRLGTAMAASGAAASPSMGYHSSPAVAFLLTVFNVRLGHWCPNPDAKYRWVNPVLLDSPVMGGEYLLKELLSQTDDKDAFVYISDGGHFENLGVYELVRRRCRYIMVVDAGQDEKRTFDDAANLIRKCYIDFGVSINIKLDALRVDAEGNSQSCFALGDIIYPATEEDNNDGKSAINSVLLYIKPSLLKNIPEDIRQYAKANKYFPHQTTSDQFFNEDQFESYRHLGICLMDQVVKSIEQQETPGGESWRW